jgi:hypothetical protein
MNTQRVLRVFFTALLLSLLCFFPLSPFAAEAANTTGGEDTGTPIKDWRFSLAAYGWLAGLKGDVFTEGVKTEIDVPFSDIFEDTQAGFMMYAEARWRKWFASFDGTWAKLGEEVAGTLANIDVTIHQKIFELKLGREIYHRYLDEADAETDHDWRREAGIDLFIGGRYFSTEPDVKITPITGPGEQLSGKDDRWDPFIGIRAGYDMSKRWSIVFKGDIGGFGIGNASEFTWQTEGTIGYRVSKLFTLFLGYRLLSFDTVEGSGSQKSGTDLLQHGPIIGAGVSF